MRNEKFLIINGERKQKKEKVFFVFLLKKKKEKKKKTILPRLNIIEYKQDNSCKL